MAGAKRAGLSATENGLITGVSYSPNYLLRCTEIDLPYKSPKRRRHVKLNSIITMKISTAKEAVGGSALKDVW